MAYQPLARKYRPSRFAELVGQGSVAQALANAIAMGCPPPAVLFTGVRGVGKTTIARLFAKALNCERRQTLAPAAAGAALDDSEPCGTCASCLAIAVGNHEDVLEIDGASNTGVGDVRALQETVGYRPQRSPFKVYIIDEVHMLSTAAFNALLKTLEETPAHVKFVFATTEVHKVPDTIMSRCQVFYLKRLAPALILGRLKDLLAREGVEAEDKAVAVIAREGHGSMRDALTLLDQAIALGGGKVTVAALGMLVSNLSSTPYLELLDAMIARDPARALATLASLDQGGAEFAAVVEETAQLARHGFVVQGLGLEALDVALLSLDEGELATLTAIAAAAAPLDLNRVFRTLVQCRTELDGSAMDRYVLENYVMEWCFDPGLPDVEQLLRGEGPRGGAGERPSSKGAGALAPAQPRSTPTDAARPGPGPGAPVPGSLMARAAAARAQAGTAPKIAPSAASPAKPSVAAAMPPPARPASAETNPPPTRPAPAETMPPAPVPAPAEAVPAPAPAGAASTTPERVGASAQALPASWRLLVEAWKQQKPLQARKLEEAHPVAYGPERIVLVVSESSYASKGLLQKDEQTRVLEQFRELFGFTGTLVVTAKAGADAPAPAVPLPETIQNERQREDAARREHLRAEALSAPFTQDLLAALGGKVEDVRIRGNS